MESRPSEQSVAPNCGFPRGGETHSMDTTTVDQAMCPTGAGCPNRCHGNTSCGMGDETSLPWGLLHLPREGRCRRLFPAGLFRSDGHPSPCTFPRRLSPSNILKKKESWFSARSPKDGAGCWGAREGLTLPSKLTSTWTQKETLVELKQSFRSPRGVQSCLCSASKTNAHPAIGDAGAGA